MTNDDEQFGKDFDIDLAAPRPAAKGAADPFDRSQWGLFPDMAVETYFADPAPEPSLGNSGMTLLLNETPKDFAWRHPRLNPDPVELQSTVAKVRGDVVHRLALGKGKDYAIAPDGIKEFRTNEAKAWRDEQLALGLSPIVREKFVEAQRSADIIRTRIDEVLEGKDYQTEVPFFYQEMTSSGPIWCRGMLDVWCPESGVIIDAKSSAMLYDEKVPRQMVAMGWDRQSAFYSHAVATIFPELGGRVRFATLLVKPEAPHTSRLVAPEKAWAHSSLRLCQRSMEIFGRCLYANDWPGFGRMVEPIQMPAWEDKRREALELGGAA